MPVINSRIDEVKSVKVSQVRPKKLLTERSRERNDVYMRAVKFAKSSRFNTNDTLKVGDNISAQWTIKGVTFWWKAKIIKARNVAKEFGKPCRIYVLKYEKQKYYPNGKIMEHCFIDERRLFDLKEMQLVSYYVDVDDDSVVDDADC